MFRSKADTDIAILEASPALRKRLGLIGDEWKKIKKMLKKKHGNTSRAELLMKRMPSIGHIFPNWSSGRRMKLFTVSLSRIDALEKLKELAATAPDAKIHGAKETENYTPQQALAMMQDSSVGVFKLDSINEEWFLVPQPSSEEALSGALKILGNPLNEKISEELKLKEDTWRQRAQEEEASDARPVGSDAEEIGEVECSL